MTCDIIECKENIQDIHHITSTCYGGTNDQFNICCLCPNHHRKTHLGELILEGQFSTTKGKILIYRKRGDDSITGLPDPKVWIFGTTKGKECEIFEENIS